MRRKRATPPSRKMNLRKKVKLDIPAEFAGTSSMDRSPSNKSSPRKDKGQLIHAKNQFLAVRNVEGSFYLCRAKQLVYESLSKFLIQWLEEDLKNPGNYDLVYFDHVEPECVIDTVKLSHVANNRYQLPPEEENRILNLLRSGQKKGSSKQDGDDDIAILNNDEDDDGAIVVDEDDDEDDDDDDEDEEEIDLDDDDEDFLVSIQLGEPANKKPRRSQRSRTVTHKPQISPSSSMLTRRSDSRKKPAKKSPKGKESTSKPVKRKVPAKINTKPPKKAGSRAASKLKPRSDIQVLKNDPFFYSREKVPFISTLVHSKLVMRAVCLKDQNLLESYINDTKHVSELCVKPSVDGNMDAMKMALRMEHLPSVQILNRELTSTTKRERVALTTSMLNSIDTGRYNATSLGGIPYIRQVAASRGCREGNNAFIKGSEVWESGYRLDKYLKFCLEQGVSKKMLDQFIFSSGKDADGLKETCFDYAHYAVKRGHRKLAGEIISDSLKTGSTNFNILHKNVLLFDNEPLPTPIREASARKTPWANDKITPIHCAAINPNPLYLSTLLNILPEPGIVDRTSRKPIHYAAACEGTGPLELLLDRNQDPDEPDKHGMTALMVACQCGRSQNVDLILKRAMADKNKNSKYGPAGINRPNVRFRGDRFEDCFSYAPIHFAVQANALECIKVLISHKADIEKGLGPNKNKATPLMLACSLGYLDVAKVLVQAGADPDKKDKIKRTPLMYSSMNGHTHVVSYLLSLGCNPDSQDSSGNTPLQYAAAYGWYFCVRLLLKAGADPNLANDWKMTPLAITFLKGHIGLADVLLEEGNISINFRMEGGVTLVMMACMSYLKNDSITDQLEYLVVSKKADCTLTDGTEKNALHHLAANNRDPHSDHKLIKMAEILLENGCDPNAKDKTGLSPLAYAIQHDNLDLASFLIQKGSKVTELKDSRGENILHMLAEQCTQQNVVNTLGVIVKTTDKDLLKQMALQVNADGYCPLLVACREYVNYRSNPRYTYKYQNKVDSSFIQEVQNDDDDDDDDDEYGREVLDLPDLLNLEVDRWSADQKADVVSLNARLFLCLMVHVVGLEGFSAQVQQKNPKQEEEEVKSQGNDQDESQSSSDDDDDDDDYEDDYSEADDDDADRDYVPKESNQDGKSSSDKDKDVYLHLEEAKFTIFHYLVNTTNERPGFFLRRPRNLVSSSSRGRPRKAWRSLEEDDDDEERMVIVDDVGDAQASNTSSPLSGSEKVKVSCPSFISILKLYRKMLKKASSLPGSTQSSSSAPKKSPLDLENGRGLTPLMVASMKNNKEVVGRLIKCGLDVNKTSGSKSSMRKGSSLLLAAKYGSFAVIPELLKAGANPGDVDPRTGCTPLHFVIMKKPATDVLLGLVKCFLDHGAPVDVTDIMKQTLLHKLAKYPRDQRKLLDSARLLLQKGAKLSAKDKWQRTPLHVCLAHNPGTINASTKLEELLLSWSSAEVDERDCLGRTPLHYAYISHERNLKKEGTDPTSLTSLMTHHSRDPKVLVNIRDHELFTPLSVAASIGAGISCIHLMEKGADPEAMTNLGNTPLALAVANGHSSCALLLFLRNCNIDQQIVTSNENERVDKKKNNYEVSCDADCFLDISDEELKNAQEANKENESGKSQKERQPWKFLPSPIEAKKSTVHTYPIIEEIIKREWQGIISMSLELNQKHSLRLSTMIEASFKNKKYNLAMNLIERSQSKDDLIVMEMVDSTWIASSRNLAHLLAKHSSECSHDESIVAVAELLIEYKVSFSASDDYGCTPLHYACLSLNKPLITFILGLRDKESVLKKDNAGRTALAALFWRHIDRSDELFVKVIEQLMAAGLSVDFCCRFSIPRHAFLRFGSRVERKPLDYFDQSLIISSSGLVVPQRSGGTSKSSTSEREGRVRRMNVISIQSLASSSSSSLSFTMVMSPLALAVMIENVHLVEVLVTLGADVNLGDGWGRSPLMYALALNNMTLVRRLLGDPTDPKSPLPHIFFEFEEIEEKKKAQEGPQTSVGSNSFQLGFKTVAILNGDSGTNKEGSSNNEDKNINNVNGDASDEDFSTKFPPILLKSKVDLNHVDTQGHPVLHYLVPFEMQSKAEKEELIGDGDNSIRDFFFPSYDNHVLFLQLESLGARHDLPDKKGRTLKARACKAGCQRLLSAIKHVEEKQNVASSFDEKPSFKHHAISDGLDWSALEGRVDPSRDAHSFLSKFEKKLEVAEKLNPEYKPIPDKNLSEWKISEVILDEELRVPFDVLLFKIDVGMWKMGLYNFYKMQATYQRSKDLYVLFTRWGRIGDTGQFQQTPFSTKEEALKEFKKIFKSKTGNEWENYHSFEAKHSKYRLVSLESRRPPVSKKHVDINLKTSLPSKLHPYVQDLIKELTNVSALKSTMDQTGFDTSAVVLGRIRKKDLEKAKGILEELQVLAKDFSELRGKSELNIEALEKQSNKLASLSNEYYHVLPKKGFQYEKLPILNSEKEIGMELANLDLLFDIELTTRFMVAAMEMKAEVNPLDYIYKCMDCQIVLLQETSCESQFLLRYISASWSGKVEAIFKVQRKSDEGKFQDEKLPMNRKLLFHGSNNSNLVSILTRGLLISPPGVQLSGDLFGHGIYMADMFSKSVNYCQNHSHSRTKYMLVCEANLGKLKAVKESLISPPEGFDSILGLGSEVPDPIYDVVTSSGAVLPLGKVVQASERQNAKSSFYRWLSKNEYITYSSDRVALRYVIQFKD